MKMKRFVLWRPARNDAVHGTSGTNLASNIHHMPYFWKRTSPRSRVSSFKNRLPGLKNDRPYLYHK